ncbi:MAG: glycosyltransferase [Candidatus Saganbacteria bacterium]|nr:glycosyltransferase [Candidatus Saganbacteria bacterium]
MEHIGLLMTCNEEDCIEEVMNEHAKYFDKILVLDGSADRTEEIIRSYDAVKYFLKDSEIIDKLPNRDFQDGARHFILSKAQEMYGYDNWITLLHGDEIFHNNPIEMAENAEKEGAQKINWYAMNFFLHTSDKGKDLDAIRSVQERVTWYCPGFLEIRSFRNGKNVYYDPGQFHQVLPQGIGLKIYRHFPVYKHYPYRSVKQILRKKQQAGRSNFNLTTWRDIEGEEGCFQEILPNYKVARKFDGSFHEFEVENQGSLFARWLRAHRYMPCKIGPFKI